MTFILLQNIHIFTSILLLVSDPLALSSMLVLVVVGIAAPNVCWFWWWLTLWYQTYVGFEICHVMVCLLDTPPSA